MPRCASTDKKNLAIEALKKLINGDVRSQSKRNVTQSQGVLGAAGSGHCPLSRQRPHDGAGDRRTDPACQGHPGGTGARRGNRSHGRRNRFYDALAENESARQVMGEPALRVIAHELVTSIKGNVTVDWMHREAARARMRVLVKRLLAQIRLSARLAGRGGAEGLATGRSVVGRLGGLTYRARCDTIR